MTGLRFSLTVCALLLLVVASSGCNGGSAQSTAQEESNLKKLMRYYGQYKGMRGKGQGPANEQALKEFIRSFSPEQLQADQVTDVDALFISERDKQPYVVLYGADAASAAGEGPAGNPVIAYEKQGVGGRRFVASDLAVEEVDDAQFRKWVPNPK